MKRIKIVGLCLVAVFALSAMVAASGAQAGTYKICVEQKKGFYGNSTCSGEKVEKKGKGKGTWELIPLSTCIPQKHGFYSESGCKTLDEKKGKGKGSFEKTKGLKFKDHGGAAKLETKLLGPNDVECTSSTSEGEYTGEKTVTDRVKFVGCTFSGLPCQSAGPESTPSGVSGTITTNLLDGKLIDHGEKGPGGPYTAPGEPAVGEVWQELVSSEHEPYSSEFECAGLAFIKTAGSISGVVTSALNTLTTTQTQEFEEGFGEQNLVTEGSETGFAGPWSPPLPSIEHAGSATVETERPVGVFD